MKILSIVTVTRNNLQGLIKTSHNLLGNSDQIEWIVVDGASPDGTQDFLSSIDDQNLVFISEPDLGIFDAMNKGLKMASGEIIIFLNAGDSFVNRSVPLSVIESYGRHNWVWAVGRAITVDEVGNELWIWPEIAPNSLKLKLAVNSYCHQSTVYRRSQLIEFGGFITDSLHSDWSTSLQFLKISPPHFEAENWTYFLAGGISSTTGLEYWFKESIRLRRITNTVIYRSRLLDYVLQKMLWIFFQTTRGQLLRPDLFPQK